MWFFFGDIFAGGHLRGEAYELVRWVCWRVRGGYIFAGRRASKGCKCVGEPFSVQVDACDVRVGVAFQGGTGIPSGTKASLACRMASFCWFGDFGVAFGHASGGCCCIQLFSDCLVGVMVIAIDMWVSNESCQKEKIGGGEEAKNDNATTVAGSAGTSHCAAIAVSAAEFVGGCCCRCCLNC